jgi:hypothetical protein
LTDDGEAGQTHTDVHLNIDGAPDDTEQRGRADTCEHGASGYRVVSGAHAEARRTNAVLPGRDLRE